MGMVHTHTHVQNQGLMTPGAGMHSKTKIYTLRLTGEQTHINMLALKCVQRGKHSLEVCSHRHTCREPCALNQLLLTTNLQLPISLHSAVAPPWPPGLLASGLIYSSPVSTQEPQESHPDSPLGGKLQQPAALRTQTAIQSLRNLGPHTNWLYPPPPSPSPILSRSQAPIAKSSLMLQRPLLRCPFRRVPD